MRGGVRGCSHLQPLELPMGLFLLVDQRRLAEQLGRERWRGGRAPPLLTRELELTCDILQLTCAAAAVG